MGIDFIHLTETVSTNLYFKELESNERLKEKTVVYSDFQTAGRGQKGNSWESEQGKNLLFSMVLYPDFIEASEQFIISQIASLAIRDVLNEYTDNITIKWPNDIYYKDQKICGMLIENDIMNTHISRSILGIGININQETFYSDAPNPVSLKQITHTHHNKEDILRKIANKISNLYDLAKSDQQFIADRYKKNLYRKDGLHSYSDVNGNVFSASIEEIEPSGILVLKTDSGAIKKFVFKEVIFR